MKKEERLKEVLEYRISRAQNEPINDMDCFIENTIKDVLEAVNPLPSDSDEAAKEYAKTTFKKPYSDNPDEEVTIVEPDKYAGFIAGAKWDREQMMSKAVCYIAQPDITATGNIVIPFIRIGYTALSRYGIKVGDKVRIIIVKED